MISRLMSALAPDLIKWMARMSAHNQGHRPHPQRPNQRKIRKRRRRGWKV